MAASVSVLNTPATALPANPALPTVTIPPGTNPALPSGGTVQPHPTIANAIVHVTPPATNSGQAAVTSKLNQPGNKFPYAPNATYQYDVIITRLTYNIAGTLPFVIGIGDEIQNQFSDFLSQLQGMATTTPASVAFTSGGALNLTYTVSSETDIIQISCAQTPYSRLIKLLETHRFKTVQSRVSISDTTALSQFNVSIKTGVINEDSETRTKPLSYVANDSPYQYQSYKIDLARNVYFSKVEGILSGIINDGIDNFSQTFSLFVTESAPTFTPLGDTSNYTTASTM